MWETLKRIPTIGLIFGAFIIGGGAYLLVPQVHADTYAFTLDAEWSGPFMQSSSIGALNLHMDGNADTSNSDNAKLDAATTLGLSINGVKVLTASGDMRVLAQKLFLRINSVQSPALAAGADTGLAGKWFMNEAAASAQTGLALGVNDPKKLFREVEDLGTTDKDGVKLYRKRVEIKEDVLRTSLEKTTEQLIANGQQAPKPEDIEKLIASLKAGSLIIAVDSRGQLYEADWSGEATGGAPSKFSLRIHDRGKKVTVEEPSPTEPLAGLMQAAAALAAKK